MAAFVNAMISDGLTRGLTSTGLGICRFHQHLRARGGGCLRSKSLPLVTLGDLENGTDAASGGDSLPRAVMDQLSKVKGIQRSIDSHLRYMEHKAESTRPLTMRIQSTIARLRARMDFNHAHDRADGEYNELGQRMEDLMHCLDAIDRNWEADTDYASQLERDFLEENANLVKIIDDWLEPCSGQQKQSMSLEDFQFQPPFDMKIVDDAETICARCEAAAHEELDELRGLPFQPEGEIMNRRWIMRETQHKIEEAGEGFKYAHRCHAETLGLKSRNDLGETLEDLDLPEDFDFQHELAHWAENIDIWQHNLNFSRKAGDRLGIKSNSTGSVVERPRFQGPIVQYGSDIDVVMWGTQEPDNERELTQEDIDELKEAATGKINPWQARADVDHDEVSVDVPSTTVEHRDLVDPEPLDSISNVGNGRINLGYSIYRNEIDEMARLRKKSSFTLEKMEEERAQVHEAWSNEHTLA